MARKASMTPIQYCSELERIYLMEEQMRNTGLEDSMRGKTADSLAKAIEKVRVFEVETWPTLTPETQEKLISKARESAAKHRETTHA